VSATNGAGLVSAATSVTVSADASAPTTTISCSGGCGGWHAAASTVTLSASDGGAGVAQILYSTDGSAPSTLYSGPFSVSTTKTVKYAASDKVGNTETVQSTLVQVDTSAPTAPSLACSAFSNASLSGATVFHRPGAAGGFTVT